MTGSSEVGCSAPTIGKVGIGKLMSSRNPSENIMCEVAAIVLMGAVVPNAGG